MFSLVFSILSLIVSSTVLIMSINTYRLSRKVEKQIKEKTDWKS